LDAWRFDENGFTEEGMGQLTHKVGTWEHFNEGDEVHVHQHDGNDGRYFSLTFPGNLPNYLSGHKMLIMHQKRTWVGVKADNVQGLSVTHVKFGAFGGAALNFKRVENPQLHGVKCQPTHNHVYVKRQNTAWATCNDLGWIRNPYGDFVRASKITCMQQTDDCLNFHMYTPKVEDAKDWFWNEWLNGNDLLALYTANGEPSTEVSYTGKDQLPSDNYVLIKKLSPGGRSPISENKWNAGVLVKGYRVFNSRSRMMIKVNNAYVRDVKVRHNFMSAINVEAEMCSKWNEGIPGRDILIEKVEIKDVNTVGRPHWMGALTIGSKCGSHQIQLAHKNIKVKQYDFAACVSGVPGCNSAEQKHDVQGVTNMMW